MKIFGTDSSRRGCFVAFTSDVDKGHGSILQLPTSAFGVGGATAGGGFGGGAAGGLGAFGGTELPESSNWAYPAIVTGIQINQQENTHFLKCFNSRIYTYTFGADLGTIIVTYLAFLARGTVSGTGGAVNTTFSAAVKDFLTAYHDGRVSASRKFATLSFGGVSKLRGLVTGMSAQTANAETNLQNFTMKLTTVEALDTK